MSLPNDQAQALLKNSEIVLGELERKRGSQNEVCASRTTELRVVYEANDFSMGASNTTDVYGIRSIVDGRLGFTTTNSSETAVLREIAVETQQLAGLSVASEHHQIAERSSPSGHVETYDGGLSGLQPKEVYELAQLVVDEARRDQRVALDRVEVACRDQVWTLTNSRGVTRTAAATECSWFAMGMGKTDNEVTSFDYDGGAVWRRREVESAVRDTMERFRASVLGSLGPKHGKSYKGAVLLHPQAVLSLLGQAVTFNCNGKNQQDGVSAWKELAGTTVASTALTVSEDPLDSDRPEGWTPFDREGVPTARHDLIRAGRLNFVAHSCFSAHRAGIAPTGNASGGPRSLPQIGFSNLTVEGIGDTVQTEPALYRALGSGLVLKRFSGNSDPISGQFSGVAKNSWWVDAGQRSHPVHEVMVAGNMLEVLKQIRAVGDRMLTVLGGNRAPYVLVDGLSVTAG